ncbi:MAG TPA: peptidoglycan-binding domain-containing protein, partial [Planctomycetaceae bacterium]
MALTSLRFAGNHRLAAAAENNPVMNWGEVGPAVRLVQQALIDLGCVMRISTARSGSPDGIFGDETKSQVVGFQRANGLTGDGVVGANTLKKLDQLSQGSVKPLPAFDQASVVRFRFRMTFRSGAIPQVPESVALANARKVYGRYGIQVDEGPGMSILVSPEQQVILDASPTTCQLNQEDQFQEVLFSLGGGRAGVPPTDVLVFYVNKLLTTGNVPLNGCASHRPGPPAVAVSSSGSPWSAAHEVGHCLLGNLTPTHSESKANLMFQSTNA